MHLRDERGQGSMEYLIILAGVLAIAAIIVFLALNLSERGSEDAEGGLNDFNQLAN